MTIAGVQVGQVGAVSLENGRAVVTMNIYRKYAPIYRDATVLLRPRTPLKDMYLALDPGTRAGRRPARRLHAQHLRHQPDRRSRPDPRSARRRHPQLPAAAPVRRGRRVPRPEHHPSRPQRRLVDPRPGRHAECRRCHRAKRHLQAVRAAGPRHAQVRHPAGRTQPEPAHRDPQPAARGHLARQRGRAARVADRRLEHELLGDRLPGRQPRGAACRCSPGTLNQTDRTLGKVQTSSPHSSARRCVSCCPSPMPSGPRSAHRVRCSTTRRR